MIRYFSDLHLEFIKPNKINKFISKIPVGMDEICCIAGDIGNPFSSNYDIFMKFMSCSFKKVFVIAGNHEYYNDKNMEETKEFMKKYFKQFTNISFLDNSCEMYENKCFIGTTLWSKITNQKYKINDVKFIPELSCEKYNQLNLECVSFLEEHLKKNENCVVLTHHLPSFKLIDEKYKTIDMSPYNQWFACDLDKLIETYHTKILCWIYGHTHTPAEHIINSTHFLCNPIGYPNENLKNNFQKTFQKN